MQTTEAKRRKPVVPAMAASKRFSMYKDEEKKEARKADVKEDKTFARLLSVWTEFLEKTEGAATETLYEDTRIILSLACEMIQYKNHKPRHIAELCLQINPENYETGDNINTKIGLFISALIEKSRYANFQIPAQFLDAPSYLAYKNRKNILIHGNVGLIGLQMKSGRVIVNGDATEWIGSHMEGGVLIVNGNAHFTKPYEPSIGNRMTGGIIRINGNVICGLDVFGHGLKIGEGMAGGEIHIQGELPDSVGLSGVIHGKIFHRGKLIVDK